MNRIDHRRLHWVLGGLTILSIGAVAMQGFGNGFGATALNIIPHTNADAHALPADQMHLPLLAAPVSPDRFAEVWNRNVFSASRVPDVHRGTPAEAPMSGYTLTGVILSGSLRIALLTDPTGKGYSVLAGHVLPHTEWRLNGLDRHAAHFDVDGQDVTLPLRKTPYAMGPPAVPGGLSQRGNSDSNASSLQQSASNDPLGATQSRADQGQTGTPGLPPLPPGM